MPKPTITEKDFATYLYAMHLIFPENLGTKGVLRVKNDISENYAPTYFDKSGFRKTVDRNWNLVEDIRKGKKKIRTGLPDLSTMKVFISYLLGDGKEQSLEAFTKNHKKEIEAYKAKNYPSEEILEQLFPKLPEKLQAIAKRIEKIEMYIDDHDQLLQEWLVKKDKSLPKSFSEQYGNQKLTLEFFNFLQLELLETKKQYQKAKILYKRLGSFGLFFVPLKYAMIDKEFIFDTFWGEFAGWGNEDVTDDLL